MFTFLCADEPHEYSSLKMEPLQLEIQRHSLQKQHFSGGCGTDYPLSVVQKAASRIPQRDQVFESAGVDLQEMSVQEDAVGAPNST